MGSQAKSDFENLSPNNEIWQKNYLTDEKGISFDIKFLNSSPNII